MTKKRDIVLILTIATFFVIAFWSIVGYVMFYVVRNEIKLESEFSKIEYVIETKGVDDSSLDEMLNNYVTKRDYLIVEKAVKNYLKDLIKELKDLREIMKAEKLIDLLSIENFKNDGKEFDDSLKYIEDTIEKVESIKGNITALNTKENIENYLDKDINEYFKEYYFEYIRDDNDETFTELNQGLDSYLNFLNKYKMFFEFLVNNKESWYIQNGQLYFEDETLLDEYNKFFANLNNYEEKVITTI